MKINELSRQLRFKENETKPQGNWGKELPDTGQDKNTRTVQSVKCFFGKNQTKQRTSKLLTKENLKKKTGISVVRNEEDHRFPKTTVSEFGEHNTRQYVGKTKPPMKKNLHDSI